MATVTSLAAARADHAQPDKSAVVERQRALTAAIVIPPALLVGAILGYIAAQ